MVVGFKTSLVKADEDAGKVADRYSVQVAVCRNAAQFAEQIGVRLTFTGIASKYGATWVGAIVANRRTLILRSGAR